MLVSSTATGAIAAACMATSRPTSSLTSPENATAVARRLPGWMYATTLSPLTTRMSPISMRSPILPTSSVILSATVSEVPGKVLVNRSSFDATPSLNARSNNVWATPTKSPFFATKSVSQFKLMTTPLLPAAFTPERIAPSPASRSLRLAATFWPFLRRISMAASKSPLASVKAFLQSIIPAPVCLRSLLTSAAVMLMMSVLVGSKNVQCQGARISPWLLPWPQLLVPPQQELPPQRPLPSAWRRQPCRSCAR